jgi:hypothetical protein
MTKDYSEAVHRSLSCGYIGLQLRTNTVNAGKVLYGQLSFFLRQPYDFSGNSPRPSLPTDARSFDILQWTDDRY